MSNSKVKDSIIKPSEATLAIQKTLASKEFKDYHADKQAVRILLARINQILKEENITKTELANRTGIPRPSLSRLLNGNRLEFSYNTVYHIMSSLGYVEKWEKA
jgi:predicted XRE-type DNA-binding protein